MAVNIQQKFSIDLNGVVENSITAVKTVRKKEQAKKESEFQRAIANGLSYEEQIKMREKQLEDERKSQFADQDYIFDLEKSIADTKKLNRFNKYRTKYTDTFGELSAGKINEQNYLDTLKKQLVDVYDPELRLEIQQDIASAEKGLKVYNDTILANKVRLAKNDGTVKTLSSMVARVNIARTNALLSNNEDEVTAHDETLAVLNSQLASVKIDDATIDFQAKSATKGTNSIEKLDFISSQIRDADPNIPVKIGDKTYTSAQQYWSITRDNYLSGTFFKELENDVKNNLVVNSKFGITQAALDNTQSIYNGLRNRPEMAPFLTQLDSQQVVIMEAGVKDFVAKVSDAAESTLEFDFADSQIDAAGKKYGVDTSMERSKLFQRVRGLEQADLIPAGSTQSLAAKLQVEIPEIKENPVTATTPTTSEVTKTEKPIEPEVPIVKTPLAETGSIVDYLASTGKPSDFNSRLELAKEKGITNYTGTSEQNVQLLNMLKGSKTTPVVTPPAPTTPETPIPTGEPVSTPTPQTPTTPATYTGTSVVDYLKSQNQESSFENRAKLAKEKGIVDYQGTAKQNEELLKSLRG